MSDWKECRNYENCGGWLESPAQVESGLCENCLIERDDRVDSEETATLRAQLAASEEREGQLCRKSNGYVVENARLAAQLAAAEARAKRYRAGMREMIDCRTCRNHTRDGCIQTALCVDADGYRRALPVRFWVATHSAALAELDGKC